MIKMHKWKINWIFIVSLLFLLSIILIPTNRGQQTSLWGTSVGTSREFTYSETFTGSIETIADSGEYQFSVLKVWDNDGNNYTELLYSRLKTAFGSSTTDLITLNDDSADWDYQNLVDIFSGGDLQPLVPIDFNNTDNMGLNWTAQLEYINNTLTNYTAVIEGNVVTIHHWDFDIEGTTNALIEEHEYLQWDRTTGWLISYQHTVTYGSPLNYTQSLSIQIKASGGGVFIDMTLLVGIIGIIVGTIGITFSLIALRKARK